MEAIPYGFFLIVLAVVVFISVTVVAGIIGGLNELLRQNAWLASRLPISERVLAVTFCIGLIVACIGIAVWNPGF
jgi:hypothetical protein